MWAESLKIYRSLNEAWEIWKYVLINLFKYNSKTIVC